MNTNLHKLIIERETALVGFALTLAESSIPKGQYPAFKRLLLGHFHKQHRPELKRLLCGASVSQGPGSATSDSHDGKDGVS